MNNKHLLMHRKICFGSCRCICITEQACKDFLLNPLTCLVMSHPVYFPVDQRFAIDWVDTIDLLLDVYVQCTSV